MTYSRTTKRFKFKFHNNHLAHFKFAFLSPGGGNTSGLARHLKRAHGDEYKQFLDSTKILSEADPKPVQTGSLAKIEDEVKVVAFIIQ